MRRHKMTAESAKSDSRQTSIFALGLFMWTVIQPRRDCSSGLLSLLGCRPVGTALSFVIDRDCYPLKKWALNKSF